MASECTSAPESVLHHVPPELARRIFRTQGRERHPQITRRYQVELPPESPARSAVVGHHHDGRDVGSHPARCPQGIGKSVSATERNYSRVSGTPAIRVRDHDEQPGSQLRT